MLNYTQLGRSEPPRTTALVGARQRCRGWHARLGPTRPQKKGSWSLFLSPPLSTGVAEAAP